MFELIAVLVDRFIKWARPLVLLPPRCHVTWRTDKPEEMHACRLTAGHEGRCHCFCGSERYKDGAVQRSILPHEAFAVDDRD